MPERTETFAAKLACSANGTRKCWDTEVKGFGLWAGKRSKTWYFETWYFETWYFQRDVGGQTGLAIGRRPLQASRGPGATRAV